ncbi:LOW QUALITY PROTEIN: protein BRANCHLESS TRICHOME [Euphorbia lathyris]|uniref:LOW QUALITY PROTEIN: protein BRANCHLESS TRICHOME n=1 Tax=Euphorbia lathyris TaxID=212925 RepID=UPI003313D327
MISKSIQHDMDHELKMMMMMTTTCSSSKDPIFPTWKLYDNPFYNHQFPPTNHPISARKIAACFWDLTFFRPIMETELELAQAQITELQAELLYERKARKRGEAMNKRLAKELAGERRGREAVERVCEELARGISFDKAEIDRLKREIEEERKMLRMAEVFREERVQMKLAEAKFFFEEKLLELEGNKKEEPSSSSANLSGKFSRLFIGETDKSLSSSSSNENFGRRVSPESENHHIKRGIKGFVEFPRVVRTIGSKNRHWGRNWSVRKLN